MINNLKKEISIQQLSKNIIYFLIIYINIFQYLKTVFGLPNLIGYLIDIIIIILVILNIKKVFFNKIKIYKIYLIWITIFFIFCLCVLAIKQQNILLFLWGVRNNFRFLIFLLLCGLCLEISDIDKIFNILKTLLWINILICSYQFFIQGFKGDYCGGLFGVEQGCNGYMNILLIIVTIISVVRYILKKGKLSNCLLVLAGSCYIAALSELKIYIFELILILLLSLFLTKFSLKKIVLVIVGCLGIILAAKLMIIYNPEWNQFFSIEEILESVTRKSGYSGAGDLNRFTGISTLSEMFFYKKIDLFIGRGLGSCEYSSFSFLISDFYNSYSYLHYTWFYATFLFIECGYMGIIFILGIYFISFFYCKKMKNKKNTSSYDYYVISQVFSICCIFLIFYNISLRNDIAYIAYFLIAIPIILDKREKTFKKLKGK